MKIGILTHHNINNYGAFMQTYCLQEKLRELFPHDDVYVINYIIKKHSLINTAGFFRIYPDKETPMSWIRKVFQPIVFHDARNQYMAKTAKVYSVEDINALGLDCIVIGSDEVWNYLDPKSYLPVKYSEGLNAKSIVAYAPSTGKADGIEDVPKEVYEAMKGFTALSARDKGAQNLCKTTLGITPQLVCDPTFLFSAPFIFNERIRYYTKNPYILFYYCNGLPKKWKEKIIENARAEGYEVLGAGEYDKLYTKVSVRITPFEWAELFKHAEYVYTGTFHGVVFSILSRKNFKVYASIKSRIKKIGALLEQFGIGDRTLTEETLLDKGENIDYDKVYEYIEKLRDSSSDYLYRAVSGEQIKGVADDTE
ncbi:MAG: polysaccharide pyruvyl transferase family protein [Eubacterium sp.]|nr:polysaccharide pyruvyl transferase family protein [Eubacterium sp.]MBR0412845.1 polysaccharide pyruvyl transferase family protein [Eubacterium sp.]